VLGEMANRVRAHSGEVTPEVFKAWLKEIKVATAVKGKELFHPIRIALTGYHSGPDLDKLIPLFENGAALGIPSVRVRIERFVGV
jgi:glutamyl/glutaminyl-tRNA synthetase